MGSVSLASRRRRGARRRMKGRARRAGRGSGEEVFWTPPTDKRSRFSVSTASRSASRAPPSMIMARAASGVGRATRARGVRGAAQATAANKLTRAQRARRVSISLCGAVKYCWKRTANSGAQRALRNAPKCPSQPRAKTTGLFGFCKLSEFYGPKSNELLIHGQNNRSIERLKHSI